MVAVTGWQEANANVAVTFYWMPLRRQIRIEGVAEKISREQSEQYFHQRPRASQVKRAPQMQMIGPHFN